MIASLSWIWCGVVYLALHLALYVAALRHLPRCCSERGIFRYHLLSASLVTCVVAVASVLSKQVGVVAASSIIVGLHGMYSLSFLELWSLAQGGYSLSILRKCALKGSLGERTGLLDLQQLGESKRKARLTSLQQLGLVRKRGNLLVLTKKGWIAAAGLRAVRWIAEQATRIDEKCG